jgi:hypothetical protein
MHQTDAIPNGQASEAISLRLPKAMLSILKKFADVRKLVIRFCSNAGLMTASVLNVNNYVNRWRHTIQ